MQSVPVSLVASKRASYCSEVELLNAEESVQFSGRINNFIQGDYRNKLIIHI